MSFNGLALPDVLVSAFSYWTVLSIIDRLGYFRSIWALLGGIIVAFSMLWWIGQTPWRPEHAPTIVGTAVVLWILTLIIRGASRLLKARK